MRMEFVGVINLDKLAGMSSARAVDRVKRILPRGTKIGHAGTLDPFATGVLLLLIGKGRKLCERLRGEPTEDEERGQPGARTAAQTRSGTKRPSSPARRRRRTIPNLRRRSRTARGRLRSKRCETD